MTTMMNNSEKTRTESSVVISICARKFLVPKKNVKPIVKVAPRKRTTQEFPEPFLGREYTAAPGLVSASS